MFRPSLSKNMDVNMHETYAHQDNETNENESLYSNSTSILKSELTILICH